VKPDTKALRARIDRRGSAFSADDVEPLCDRVEALEAALRDVLDTSRAIIVPVATKEHLDARARGVVALRGE